MSALLDVSLTCTLQIPSLLSMMDSTDAAAEAVVALIAQVACAGMLVQAAACACLCACCMVLDACRSMHRSI